MLFEFIQYFLLFLFVLFGVILGGYGILRLFVRIPPKLSSLPIILGSACLGILAFVIIFSCLLTSFKSVNVIFLPLFLFFMMELRRIKFHFPSFTMLKFRDYIYLFVFALIFFSIGFWGNVKSGDFLYIVKPSDNNFYSEVSQFISITGQENIYTAHNLISEDYLGVTPYHYLEIWFNSGISFISGHINLLTLKFVTFPLFQFLVFLVIVILISDFFGKGNQYILSLLMMFLTGFVLQIYLYFFNTNIIEPFCTNVFIRNKLSSIFIFIGLFLIQIKYGDKFLLSFFTLLIIPIVSFTTLPAVYGGVLLLCLSNSRHRLLGEGESRRLTIYVLIICLCFILFYLAFGNNSISGNNSASINLLEKNLRPEYLLRRLMPLLKVPFGVIVSYFPYIFLIGTLILMIFLKYKVKYVFSDKEKLVFIIFSFTFFSGISAWSLLYYSPDAFQLSENFSSPFFSLCLVLTITYLLSEIKDLIYKMFVYAILLILLSFNIIYTFYLLPLSKENLRLIGNNMLYGSRDTGFLPSDEFLLSIEKLFKSGSIKNLVGVSLADSSDFITLDHKSILVNRSGYYLRYFQNNIGVISISDFDIPISKEAPFEIGVEAFLPEIEKKLVHSSSFYRFVQGQIKNGDFVSIQNSQLDFILKYKIQYMLMTSKAEVPNILKPLIKMEIKDEVTGQRFALLHSE